MALRSRNGDMITLKYKSNGNIKAGGLVVFDGDGVREIEFQQEAIDALPAGILLGVSLDCGKDGDMAEIAVQGIIDLESIRERNEA